MAIEYISDIAFYNENFYYCGYNKDADSLPHMIKQNSDLTLTDLGILGEMLGDYYSAEAWYFLQTILGLFAAPALDFGYLTKIENDILTPIPELPYLHDGFSKMAPKTIREIDGKLWFINPDDPTITTYDGVNVAHEGYMDYDKFSGHQKDIIKINNDIYLLGKGFYKYNPTYSYPADDNTKWEIINPLIDYTSIGLYTDSIFFNNILFVSGNSKIGILNLDTYIITPFSLSIPYAKFFIVENDLYCSSTNKNVYKFNFQTLLWETTFIAAISTQTLSWARYKIRYINGKLYSAGCNTNKANILTCI